MKKMSMAVAVSSIALVAPGLAAADSFNYAAVKGGLVLPRNVDFKVNPAEFDGFQENNDQSGGVETRFDNGFKAGLAFGRQFDINRSVNLRTELEAGYSETEVDSHTLTVRDTGNPQGLSRTVSQEGLSDPDGDLEIITGFLSVYMDSDIDLIDRANFIFGGGGGVANVSFSDFEGNLNGNLDGNDTTRVDDDDTSLAWHVTAGWSYDVTDRVALEATYRYVSIEDVSLKSVSGLTTSKRVDTQRLSAGIRFGF